MAEVPDLQSVTATHRRLFLEFSRAELASGGPDPQVRLAATGAGRTSDPPTACGWFVGPYTCGAAAVLWQWLEVDEEDLRRLMVDNANGIPTRRERRAIWGTDKAKLARNLVGWRDWTRNELPHVWRAPYPELYASVQKRVPYFGRYATMKVLETLHIAGYTTHRQSDIRSHGATFPRRMLAALRPDVAEVCLSKRNDPETLEIVDRAAAEVRDWSGIESWFDFETLLCNSRQAYAGKYPGRSHDRELAHWRRAEVYLGRDEILELLPFYEIRSRLFDLGYLGERGDPPWDGSREHLELETRAHYRDEMKRVGGKTP